MSFLSPIFLLALSAIGVPLIIHLLNLRRPERVRFSTLAFFEELQKTTIRKIKVKRYLLLLLRLLAIACLAMVLARPFLPPGFGNSTNTQSPSLNAVLIDNSISMSRIGEQGPLIEQAKKIIASIEQKAKESDRFILQVTNGEEQYSTILGHNQLLRKLDELKIQPSGNYAIERINDLYEILEEAPYENKRLFIISDGQLSQFSNQVELIEAPRSVTSTFISLEQVEVQNTVINGIESSTNMIGAGLPIQLSVNIENKADIPIANQFVSLEYKDVLVGQYSLSLPANSSGSFDFEITPSGDGISNGRILIEGDEFTLDNEYFFSIQVPEVRNILWIKDKDQPQQLTSYTQIVLEASNNNDSQLSYKEGAIEILGTNEISEFDAIIFDGVESIPEFAFTNLQDYVQSGKGLIFFPSEKGDIRNYNSFLSEFNLGSFDGIVGEYGSFKSISKGTSLLEEHPIFTGLFDKDETDLLRITNPDIYYYYKLRTSSSPGGFTIFSLNNGDPLIREKKFGDGKIIVSSIGNDPGWSNFSVKPLYAPLYYRTLLYAASSADGGFTNHSLGAEFNWIGDINPEESSLTVKGETVTPEARVIASGVQISYPAKAWSPGWVTLSDNEKTYSIASNLERKESDFIKLERSNLEQFSLVDASELDGESIENEIQASGFGREIWSWFMLAGLLFLVLESLVSVYYKAETIN